MYYKISDFISDWKYESEATVKVFSNLTDESLSKKVHEKIRTPGILAWHIVNTIPEMMSRTGLKFESIKHDSPVPTKTLEILNAYKLVSEKLLKQVKGKWGDETLKLEDDMYGEMWSKGKTLGVLVTHQIHHRGELIIIMRMNGLKVPGIYGPSREEWAAIGIQAQE